MLQDLRALCQEVTSFRAKLKELPDVHVQNIATIARRIEKELNNLENADPNDQIHNSTNTPDLVRLWRLARSLPALSGFSVNFRGPSRQKEDSVTVDLLYRRGHAWLCRSSLKYRALITEITNLPMVFSDSVPMDIESRSTIPRFAQQDSFISLESDSTDDDLLFSSRNIDQLKITEIAKKLVNAAGNNLKLGSVPNITIYFSRITEDCRNDEDLQNIRLLFDHLNRMGISCSTEIDDQKSFELNVGLQLKDDFGNEPIQLPDGAPIHLDLTTLFVLCSDISNVPLDQLAKTHQALHFQLQEEATVPCLRDRIFPIIRGSRPLICTPLARGRFLEIVEELGSHYERQRATLMFSTQPAHLSCNQLSSISIHVWPNDISFPIIPQKFTQSARHDAVPLPISFKTAIAQECFESAWYGRLFTLSANQQAIKTFREALFNWPDEEDPRPTVFLHAARSLTMYDRTPAKSHDVDM